MIGCWVLTGLLTFLIIEKAFPDGRSDEDEEEEEEKEETEQEHSKLHHQITVS